MKKPRYKLQNESLILDGYTEEGADNGAKLQIEDVSHKDALEIYKAASIYSTQNLHVWLNQHRSEFSQDTVIVDMYVNNDERFDAYMRDVSNINVLYFSRPLHTVLHLNNVLSHMNQKMQDGGYLFCHSRTAVLKKKLILKQYPWGIRWVVYTMHFLWHRVCPKLRITEKLYYKVTKGKNRTFNRVEVMGRIYRAGFEVVEEKFRYGEFCIVARKIKPPICDDEPSCYPIIKLNRIGKNGKMIGVYKFRTMYSYSEYIQPYVYTYQHLDESGKFSNDYRVNKIGKFLRKYYLDELPMLLNFLKGEMKLVGVRPLSPQYYSLYTPEMQQLRIKTKPGLFPPFHAEKEEPKTLEEIQESERRYIEAYLKHPFRTDWIYFWRIFYNIIFAHHQSH